MFTDKSIKSLPKGDHRDNGPLYVRIGARSISWFCRPTVNGRRKRQVLGNYPQMSLKQARDAANTAMQDASMGFDPTAVKAERKSAPTMSTLWEKYLERQDKAVKKISDAHMYEQCRRWDTIIEPALGLSKVEDITPPMIIDLMDRVAKPRRKTNGKSLGGPVAANRLYSQLRTLFKLAIQLGYITVHPMQWLDRPGGAEVARKRVLTEDELRIVIPHFLAQDSNHRTIYMLSLLTLQRFGEICSMKWSDLDLTEKVWNQENNKTDEPIIVPLSDYAVQLLQEHFVWQQEKGVSEYVFQSYRKNKTIPYIDNVTRNRQAIVSKTGLENFTNHDLRRSSRTLLSKLGVDKTVREMLLNHKQKGIEGVYDRFDYLEEKRDAIEQLSSLILALTR